MTITLLDPTGERRPVERPRAPRPLTLAGCAVALLDISKPRGDIFLGRLDELLVSCPVTLQSISCSAARSQGF